MSGCGDSVEPPHPRKRPLRHDRCHRTSRRYSYRPRVGALLPYVARFPRSRDAPPVNGTFGLRGQDLGR